VRIVIKSYTHRLSRIFEFSLYEVVRPFKVIKINRRTLFSLKLDVLIRVELTFFGKLGRVGKPNLFSAEMAQSFFSNLVKSILQHLLFDSSPVEVRSFGVDQLASSNEHSD